MADYNRMQRHLVYRKVGFGLLIFSCLSAIPECYAAIVYHFPIWDDIAATASLLIFYLARLIIRKTEMYVMV